MSKGKGGKMSDRQLLARLAQVGSSVGRHEKILATQKGKRDQMIVEASARGISLRAIGGAAGIAHTTVREIVEKGNA